MMTQNIVFTWDENVVSPGGFELAESHRPPGFWVGERGRIEDLQVAADGGGAGGSPRVGGDEPPKPVEELDEGGEAGIDGLEVGSREVE